MPLVIGLFAATRLPAYGWNFPSARRYWAIGSGWAKISVWWSRMCIRIGFAASCGWALRMWAGTNSDILASAPTHAELRFTT